MERDMRASMSRPIPAALIAASLASAPDGEAKSDGIKLGEAVAARVLEARANDGPDAPDDYRPRTTPGVYIPTPITAGSTWPGVKPFAMTKASQFRPPPPIALGSETWAKDFNELCDYGGKTSAKRSAQQTQTPRFWPMVGPQTHHPFARHSWTAEQMSVEDSARFMALVAGGINHPPIPLFVAQHHHHLSAPHPASPHRALCATPPPHPPPHRPPAPTP